MPDTHISYSDLTWRCATFIRPPGWRAVFGTVIPFLFRNYVLQYCCHRIYITKHIRYLLWDRVTEVQTLLAPCIRCTDHLCDSCLLTDFDLFWHHWYMSWSLTIVTSQWAIVPTWSLWTLSYQTGVEVSELSGLWNTSPVPRFFKFH